MSRASLSARGRLTSSVSTNVSWKGVWGRHGLLAAGLCQPAKRASHPSLLRCQIQKRSAAPRVPLLNVVRWSSRSQCHLTEPPSRSPPFRKCFLTKPGRTRNAVASAYVTESLPHAPAVRPASSWSSRRREMSRFATRLTRPTTARRF